MVMKMNKEKVVNELLRKMNRNMEDCNTIYEILESHSIIGRKNKEKIKAELIEKLSITDDEADKIYNISMEIVVTDFFNK